MGHVRGAKESASSRPIALAPDRVRPALQIEFAPAPRGETIAIGELESPFGPCVLGWVGDVLVRLGFGRLRAGGRGGIEALFDRWVRARCRFVRAEREFEPFGRAIFARAHGAAPPAHPIRVRLHGTPFEHAVWRALCALRPGERASYGALAAAIGRPRAARAVGRACGANPVGFLVPCHRVVRTGGALGGYRWGLDVKRRLLAWERRIAVAAQGKIPSSR